MRDPGLRVVRYPRSQLKVISMSSGRAALGA